MPVGQTTPMTARYTCTILTCDPTTSPPTIEAALKGADGRSVSIVGLPAAWRWPEVGETWVVRQENGSWYLDGRALDPSDSLPPGSLTSGQMRLDGNQIFDANGNQIVAVPSPGTAGQILQVDPTTGQPTWVTPPYAYGWWSPVAVGANASAPLSILNIGHQQGGMVVSGGGWKVPMAGVYDIQCRARIDGNGVMYAAINILINGTAAFTPVQDNSSTPGVTYQYRIYQIAQRWPLHAGDVVSVQASTAGNSATVNLNGGDGLTLTYCFPYVGS